MAVSKTNVEENEVLTPQPPVTRTPIYHTTLSLGFELMKLTHKSKQEKENWEKEK